MDQTHLNGYKVVRDHMEMGNEFAWKQTHVEMRIHDVWVYTDARDRVDVRDHADA